MAQVAQIYELDNGAKVMVVALGSPYHDCINFKNLERSTYNLAGADLITDTTGYPTLQELLDKAAAKKRREWIQSEFNGLTDRIISIERKIKTTQQRIDYLKQNSEDMDLSMSQAPDAYKHRTLLRQKRTVEASIRYRTRKLESCQLLLAEERAHYDDLVNTYHV